VETQKFKYLLEEKRIYSWFMSSYMRVGSSYEFPDHLQYFELSSAKSQRFQALGIIILQLKRSTTKSSETFTKTWAIECYGGWLQSQSNFHVYSWKLQLTSN
jgi:hypothetical protein